MPRSRAKEGFYLVKSVIRHADAKAGVSLPSGKSLELKKLPRNPYLPLCFLRDV